MQENQPNTNLLIEGPQPSAEASEQPEQALTDEAMERMREVEKVSGFGRFALKLQSAFQRPGTSGASAARQWRLAPFVISAVLLFVIALGLLFVLSKPESSVSRRAKKAATLVGPEDNKQLSTAVSAPPPVTENQLVGSDGSVATQRLRLKPRVDFAAQRPTSSAFSAARPAAASEYRIANAASSALQAPATVFTAAAPISAVSNISKQTVPATTPDLRLPTGTEIAAHTTNAISSGLDSPVIAVVDRAVALNGIILIPRGTQAIGQTAGAARDRINIRFTSVVLPDQRELPFSALALMRDGSAGLEGKAQGNAHPVLAAAGQVATGAAVLATEFAGQGSGGLDRPFSEGDMLRNQLASEIAMEGNRYSNRLQRPFNVPIIKVPANQSIRIFLLSPMRLAGNGDQIQPSAEDLNTAKATSSQVSGGTDEGLAAAQAQYIQSLESQIAQLRAALESRQQAAQH